MQVQYITGEIVELQETFTNINDLAKELARVREKNEDPIFFKFYHPLTYQPYSNEITDEHVLVVVGMDVHEKFEYSKKIVSFEMSSCFSGYQLLTRVNQQYIFKKGKDMLYICNNVNITFPNLFRKSFYQTYFMKEHLLVCVDKYHIDVYDTIEGKHVSTTEMICDSLDIFLRIEIKDHTIYIYTKNKYHVYIYSQQGYILREEGVFPEEIQDGSVLSMESNIVIYKRCAYLYDIERKQLISYNEIKYNHDCIFSDEKVLVYEISNGKVEFYVYDRSGNTTFIEFFFTEGRVSFVSLKDTHVACMICKDNYLYYNYYSFSKKEWLPPFEICELPGDEILCPKKNINCVEIFSKGIQTFIFFDEPCFE